MDRKEILRLRRLVESKGYIVEMIYDNGLLVSHLDDPMEEKFFLSKNDICPTCGECLLFNEERPNECKCINDGCKYQAATINRERVSPVEKETFIFTIKCPKDAVIDVNSFMDEATKLIYERYHDLELTYEIVKNKRRK